MTVNKKKQAHQQNEQTELISFQFSESKQTIRNILIDSKPWFVAKDICDVLEISNNRDAILKLDDDEKLMSVLPTSGQNRKAWMISESGLYALVLRSSKPQAKVFRKWITSEVIPALMKKGFYHLNTSKAKGDYIDARDIPFQTQPFNNHTVRVVSLNGMPWIVINDITTAISARTGSYQIAKKLNSNQTLAKKIWLYGNTHPAWCTNELGVKLILAGSRALKNVNQLTLKL